MQIYNETLKPGHVSNWTQALMVRSGPVKKIIKHVYPYRMKKIQKSKIDIDF